MNFFSRRTFLKKAGLGLAGFSIILSSCTKPSTTEQTETSVSTGQTDYMVYVGTYAKPDAESIFGYRLNSETGELTRELAVKGGENPSYLVLDAERQYLYAVNETEQYKGQESGYVSAFAVDQQSGNLTYLNEQPSGGGAPCYISLDQSGKVVMVANYVGGNVSTYKVETDGKLSAPADLEQHKVASKVDKQGRQEAPHAHCLLADPTNQFAFAADLGKDQLIGYRLDAATGQLTPSAQPAFVTKPGAGPRHLVFHPNKKYAYVINEISSSLTALTYDAAKGQFTEVQTVSTLPADFTGENNCAHLEVSKDGRFVYGSNRGHNSISVFEVDPATNKLTMVQNISTEGNWPRNFTFDPSGKILLVANQRSNNIATYKVDTETGKLTYTGFSTEVKEPVCLKVVPSFSTAK